ncbi:MAG: zf-HC2 domain-containing protein [Solirubrobacterales bacterium]
MNGKTTLNPIRMTRFMIDHMWVRTRVSSYLDGELSDAGQARLRRHEIDCPECHETIEKIGRILGALPLLRREQPGHASVDRTATAVLARIQDR